MMQSRVSCTQAHGAVYHAHMYRVHDAVQGAMHTSARRMMQSTVPCTVVYGTWCIAGCHANRCPVHGAEQGVMRTGARYMVQRRVPCTQVFYALCRAVCHAPGAQ